jgi:hypothetical protein
MVNLPVDPIGGDVSQPISSYRSQAGEVGKTEDASSVGSMNQLFQAFIDIADQIIGGLIPLMGFGSLLQFLVQGADALFSVLQQGSPITITNQQASEILNFLTFLEDVAQSPGFSNLPQPAQTAIDTLINNTGIQQLQSSLESLYNYENANGLLNEPESQWTPSQQTTVNSMISTIEQTDIPDIQNSSSYDSIMEDLHQMTQYLSASVTEWMVDAKLEMGKLSPLMAIPANIINQSVQQETQEEGRITGG